MPPDDAPTATVPDPTPAPPSTLPNGDPLAAFEAWATDTAAGRYRLLSVHRTGGLGRVWRAEDTTVGRVVAVKGLRPDRTASPDLRARFVREAEVTGQLEHPNIVPLYDLFHGPDGPAYVMRFVDGQTLAEAAAAWHTAGRTADPLALPRLLDAFGLVCRAVGFAHTRGVLHRDLKGQNVLLGKHGAVWLADWGLAKRVGEPDRPGDPHPLTPDPDAAITATGAVLGTPAFMAPEVARGGPASVASDVYGLGAVLYQLLTNRLPHTGSTPQEVLGKVGGGEPVVPARTVNPRVPPALDAVCRKATAADPADRYPSAEALADDVRRFLAGERVEAYPEPLPARAARWARRHKGGVLVGVVALAVLAAGATAGAGLLWQQQRQTDAARQAAVAEREEADRQRAVADSLYAVAWEYSRAATDALVAAEAGQAAGAGVAKRADAVGRAAAEAEKLLAALPDNPAVQQQFAQLQRYTCTLARLTNDRPLAERAADRAVALLAGLAARFPDDPARQVTLALALEDAATVRTLYGRRAAAAALLDRATAVLGGLPADARARPMARRAAALIQLQRAAVALLDDRFAAAEGAATTAADEFARLAADPAGRHPHDPVLHGLARLAVAAAARERGAAGDGDYGPALAAGQRAVEVLDAARQATPHPDAVVGFHRAVVERAATRLRAGDRPAEALAGVDQACDEFRRLMGFDPAMPAYKQGAAAARQVSGAIRAADPADRDRATADLREADKLWDELARAGQDRPDYRLGLAETWAELARLAAPAARQAGYDRVGAAARAALTRADGAPLYKRTLDRFAAAAKADGCNLGRPKKPAGP